MATGAIADPCVCTILQTEHPTALQLETPEGKIFIVGNGGCALHRDYVISIGGAIRVFLQKH